LQSLHAAAADSGNAYWRPTLAIACSPLDAGQTDIMIGRHDRPTADFRDAENAHRAHILFNFSDAVTEIILKFSPDLLLSLTVIVYSCF